MKTLPAILAAALLATVATVAQAGDPIPGDWDGIGFDRGVAMKRGPNDYRGKHRSINWGDGHQRRPISDQAQGGVLTKQKH